MDYRYEGARLTSLSILNASEAVSPDDPWVRWDLSADCVEPPPLGLDLRSRRRVQLDAQRDAPPSPGESRRYAVAAASERRHPGLASAALGRPARLGGHLDLSSRGDKTS